MKTKIAISILLILFLAGFTLYSFLNLVNAPDVDTLDLEPEVQLRAEELISYFKLQKRDDDSYYLEKVVGIKGVLNDVNNINNRYTLILDGGRDEPSSIICDMQANQSENVKKLKPGDTIFLKGVLKGFLKDVILLNCVMTNKELYD
ncbi:hypothetical protein OO010_07355 [Flavobacteriaceae bacterium KMM 6898]|nr:hypothetical protein [Flavobacteriaceae bacterium KMM 6898]